MTHEQPSAASTPPAREPLPAQQAIAENLRRFEPRAWQYFASPHTREKLANAARLELLKSAYRIDRASWPEWYAAAEQVARQLGLSAPVMLYQAQSSPALGASLARITEETHLVLRGPVATKLPPDEFRALLARELCSLWQWRHGTGELLTAQYVLDALTAAAEPHPAYLATARRFGLWSRLVGDRGALAVVNDVNVVVSLLARLDAAEQSAGLANAPVEPVTSAALLLRADEALRDAAPGKPPSEILLRAWAVRQYAQQGHEADAVIERAVCGTPRLAELDSLGRSRLTDVTRRLTSALLAAEWFHTPAVLAHARAFFGDYQPPEHAYEDVTLAHEIRASDASLRDYCCYVLLDFVAADRELRDRALPAATQLAGTLGLKERFTELAQDELRLRKKARDKHDS